ncbi:MAG: YihY/virulence factor BrkB family protein [Planctomycetota bacterium]
MRAYLGGLSWRELGKRLWRDQARDELLGRAGELAYFFLLALFPMLLFLVALIGMALGSGSALRANLFASLQDLMPESALAIVRHVVDETAAASGGGKAFLGLLLALWSASAGMSAVMRALCHVHQVAETRSFWRSRGIAIALTVGVGALMLVAVASTVLGDPIARAIGSAIGAGSALVMVWNLARWPAAILLVITGYALIYRYGPDRRDRDRRRLLSPGAIVGAALWLAASVGFRVYVSHFGNYSATYGSLGAVILLMLWFYLTGLALLVGAEVDAEVESAQPSAGERRRRTAPMRRAA